jgi:hypothetical protein
LRREKYSYAQTNRQTDRQTEKATFHVSLQRCLLGYKQESFLVMFYFTNRQEEN